MRKTFKSKKMMKNSNYEENEVQEAQYKKTKDIRVQVQFVSSPLKFNIKD